MNKKMKRARLILPLVLATALLSGCSFLNSLVYRIDIPQGNYVDQKQVDQLRVDMSEAQVRYVLGSPMLKDAFTPNKWYYIYHYQQGNGPLEQHKLILTFNNHKLKAISGDYHPSADFNTPINASPQVSTTKPADNN